MKNLVSRAVCAAALVMGVAAGPGVAEAQSGLPPSTRLVAGFVTPMEPDSEHLIVSFTVPTITCAAGENSQVFLGTAVYATGVAQVPFSGVRLACVDGSAKYEGLLGYFQGRPIWPVLPGDRMRARVYPHHSFGNLSLIDRRTGDDAISGWPAQGDWAAGSAGVYRSAQPVTDFTSTHFWHLSNDSGLVTPEMAERSVIQQRGLVLVDTSHLFGRSSFNVTWEHG
jgi:hypothetical protein